MKQIIIWLSTIILLINISITSCSNSTTAIETEKPIDLSPTDLPTFTLVPTDPIFPTPTVIRTPPALPPLFQTPYLGAYVMPHFYIQDACQYLKLKWDPEKSEPGTFAMVIMFHSIVKVEGEITDANQITLKKFKKMMAELKNQGFEAINTEQLANFLESNAWIPPRSVLLLVDDRHYAQYFDTRFRKYWEDWGWPVVNAWISHPDTLEVLWAEMEALAAEGWVDFQAHGVIHNTPISNISTEEYVLNELQGSISAIQDHFNKTPIAFIWPGGGFTPRAAQMARQSGYRLGFTINSRGPVMFNWIPLSVQKDPDYPIPIPEGPVGDPLMVLPRYWPSQVLSVLDEVRIMGKEAATYAEQNRQVEFEFYEILCEHIYGPLK